ncbi:MAG: FAD/NAD(P)-binding oxidoreductase [Gammaproteobacteria bacterium]|nr:FAD/NAD(P)-binding oxidoreductase [Gammaproteobacteria bacterium]MDP2139288.1 FAD/NAD(P)-binding oxidoreductase [Gammaproteobacteria bacterium]MDP2346773.1 FAD/NAD(P)-binding oxidoreductase [Gammaproteobacteria bacterium]
MTEALSSDQVCVVVGASHAGSQLAVQLRKEGWMGRIILISAEPHLPYHRPPLSKAVLAGEKTVESVLLRPGTLYDTNAIELRLGQRVEQLFSAEKRVILSSGEVITYDRLALCTGARVRRIALGEVLQGVHYLRTADDVLAIRQELMPEKKAVIVGGGYIGLEVAAVFTSLGIKVTLLEMAERILQRVTGPVISEYLHDLHRHHGVNIVTGASVVSISGEDQVSGVICEDGTEYPADLVIIGVGVIPETDLAEAAELQVSNGIVVDEYTRTSDPCIYAAGDCTWHPSNFYGRHLRLECVQNALDQSRVAAANIAGGNVIYDALPWFWSDQYDVKLQSAGLLLNHDHFLVRGDKSNADGRGFSVFYFQGERMVAADCINRAKEFMVCKRLIADRLAVNMQALADDSSQPDEFAAVQETR